MQRAKNRARKKKKQKSQRDRESTCERTKRESAHESEKRERAERKRKSMKRGREPRRRGPSWTGTHYNTLQHTATHTATTIVCSAVVECAVLCCSVCCSVLQCVAVCCIVLHCCVVYSRVIVATGAGHCLCSVFCKYSFQHIYQIISYRVINTISIKAVCDEACSALGCSVLRVCCSVLLCIAVYYSVLQHVAVRLSPDGQDTDLFLAPFT